METVGSETTPSVVHCRATTWLLLLLGPICLIPSLYSVVSGRTMGLKRWCFKEYAVLGDDVVIAHPQVAAKYEELLGKLGVSISKDKSLISETGCLEFANSKVFG